MSNYNKDNTMNDNQLAMNKEKQFPAMGNVKCAMGNEKLAIDNCKLQIANCPRLRFPEFSGEWVEKRLGEIGTFIRGLSYNKSETTDDTSKTLVIRSNNIIQDGAVDCLNGLQFVIKSPTPEQILQKNDIVICLANGSSNLVGKTASFDGIYNGTATVGAFCGIYRSSSPIAKYLVQTSLYKDKIALIKQGGNGALANLYGKDILELFFLLPPTFAEQQKIADCLSALDETIAAEQQKVEALKLHKKGLMQQMFPAMRNEECAMGNGRVPQLRFPGFSGEWVEKKLGEVAKFSKGKGISRNDIVIGGKTPCIRYGELYTHYGEIIDNIISHTDIPVNQLVFSEKNDVIIPSSGETQEDIATASCVLHSGIALGGDLNIIRPTINGIFLSYYLNNAKRFEISKLSQGFSIVHLYNENLQKLVIYFPPTLAEQQKIADCLSALDDTIAAEQQKVEALKLHKKGLMQQLFPMGNVQ